MGGHFPNLAVPLVAVDRDVTSALETGAPVAIGVSGGKDSQAAVIATMGHLDAMRHTGPIILIHADLGIVEWDDSLSVCRDLARRFGVDLVVVSRKAGGLMERWEARWQSSVDRYCNLLTVTLVPCWSTPAMRFCTSELKTHVITAELRRRFPGRIVVNVTGVRRAESASRARKPISDCKPGLVNWRPVLDWSEAEVFAAIDASGMQPHPAYRCFGMSRVSCRFCIMSNGGDLTAAAAQPEAHSLYRRMVALEATSGFAFQGARWLGDVAPHILGADLVAALEQGKVRATKRREIEARVPDDLLYVKGWPVRVPDQAEADLLASVRSQVSDLYGFEASHLTPETVIGRYVELMALKDARDARKAIVGGPSHG
jgi:3'-phosphoadenosine 5'-phosphosulfate sulfotransferase (PAPS reductase)/FAD synthetase